jgi:hypothetical protein
MTACRSRNLILLSLRNVSLQGSRKPSSQQHASNQGAYWGWPAAQKQTAQYELVPVLRPYLAVYFSQFSASDAERAGHERIG